MKRILFALLIIWVMIGCITNRAIEFTLDNAKDLMLSRPDSSLQILEMINRNDITRRKTKARYSLLYSQALDKNWIDVDNDSLIFYAVEYFKNHGKDDDRANAYYYQGVVYYNASDVENAMESFVKARLYAERTEDHYLKGLIYSILGNLYYDQYSFDEAITMYSNAASAFSDAGSKKNLLNAIHSKGLAEAYLNRPQNAFKSFEKAMNLAIEQADTAAFLDIVSSMGGFNAKELRDSTSISSIKERLFRTYKKFTHNVIPLEHYPIIGNIYLMERNTDSAKLFFLEYLKRKPQISEANLGLFAILSSLELQKGKYKEALKYEKMYSFYTDSVNTTRKNILIQNLEKKYKAEYFQKSFIALQTKNKYEVLVMILVIILILIIVGLIVISLIRAIRVRNQQIAEYQTYVLEVQQHYTELKEEFSRLTDKVHSEKSQALLTILKNRIQSLKSILGMASKYENNTDEFYKKFKDHIKVVSGKDKELAEDVITIADLSCNGIIKHLKELYPSLSLRELSYCGFICLGFTPESIRILYNHTNVYSIYTMRSKIRSKMGLTKSLKNLETHIVDIMQKQENTYK